MNERLKLGLAGLVVYTGWFIVDRIDHKAGNVVAVLLILAALMYQRTALTDELHRLGLL